MATDTNTTPSTLCISCGIDCGVCFDGGVYCGDCGVSMLKEVCSCTACGVRIAKERGGACAECAADCLASMAEAHEAEEHYQTLTDAAQFAVDAHGAAAEAKILIVCVAERARFASEHEIVSALQLAKKSR